MCWPWGGARPAVPWAPEVGAPLSRAAQGRRGVAPLDVLGQLRCGCGQVVQYPMHPGPGRRVGIVGDKREGDGARRRAAPAERRRYVSTVARVLAGVGLDLIDVDA